MASPKQQRVITGAISRRLTTAIFAINLLILPHSTQHHVVVLATASPSSPVASATARSRRNDDLLLNCHERRQRHRQLNTPRPFLVNTPSPDATASLSSCRESLEILRGGGAAFLGGSKNNESSIINGARSVSTASSKDVDSTKKTKQIQLFGATAIATAAIALSIFHWDTIKTSLSTFFDKEKFRKAIIDALNDIASKGNTGLALYAFGFIFWEVCGLPTSVVETAAGMAFGFHKGLLGSFVGKSLGSMLAFTLGRTLLSDAAGKKMAENQSFGLIQRGVAHNPMLSAMVVRYSPFPEFIKNFALSVTKPVTYPMFVLAIAIHGFPFSVLWAALGTDSSLRLRASEAGEAMAANVVLNGLLVFVTIFGFVVSPAVTGWWLAGLRKENDDLL